MDIVVLLLQSGAQVDATTKDLYTALHIAAKEVINIFSDIYKVDIFLRNLSSIDLSSLKIQIVGGNLFKHQGFKSLLGKVKFFCPVLFSYSP